MKLMTPKIRAALYFLYSNFGPLIVFYGVNHFWGLKPAIAASTVFSILEIAIKVYRKERITGIFKYSAIMTLVFGAVDLYAQQSFLFKYESTVTNLFTAFFFGSTIFAEKTILQDYYEKSKNSKPMTADRVAYFKILTGVWVFYFVAKACAYFWIARHFTIEQSLLIRTLVGSGSLYVMLFISIFGSKKMFPLLSQWGVLGKPGSEG